jgi:hypothetical protein
MTKSLAQRILQLYINQPLLARVIVVVVIGTLIIYFSSLPGLIRSWKVQSKRKAIPLREWSSIFEYPSFGRIDKIISSVPTVAFSSKSTFDRVMHIPYFQKPDPARLPYSTFRCAGDETDHEAWTTRTCLFMNVCYDLNTNVFQFYSKGSRPRIFEKRYGPIDQFGMGYPPHGFASTRITTHSSFTPHILYTVPPKLSAIQRLTNVHALTRHWAPDHNFGHVLWEEFAHIFYSAMRMGIDDPDMVIMHEEGVPKSQLYHHFMRMFLPAVSTQPMVSMKEYLSTFNTTTTTVCFDELLVGGHVQVFFQPQISWNYGREPLFKAWRDRIMRIYDADPSFVPKRHKIIIVKKKNSGRGALRTIANLEEVYQFVKDTYSDIEVDLVEWNDISMFKQLKMLSETTLMISPPGGVSMTIPFLPDGAHAIVMDYYNEYNYEHPIGWFGPLRKGESISMDAALWGYFPHVKKLYYQVRLPSEYVKHEVQNRQLWQPIHLDTRDYASVIVNMTKLQRLINQALENME